MEFKPSWILSFVAILAIRLAPWWLLTHSRTSRARRVHGAVIFRSSGLAIICGVSCVIAICIVVGGWNQDARTLTTVIGTTWLLFDLWLWPATIVLDAKGVTAKHIWRTIRLIPYSDIDYATRMADGQIIVYGKGLVSEIRVGQYHAAPDEFESELKKRGIQFFR
jgi:hypothetical protein